MIAYSVSILWVLIGLFVLMFASKEKKELGWFMLLSGAFVCAAVWIAGSVAEPPIQ